MLYSVPHRVTCVRAVAINFDLWMSRKTEDTIYVSTDIYFIDSSWRWYHKYIDIFNRNTDNTTGHDIAKRVAPALRGYGMLDCIIAIVKDSANLANLATATRVLAAEGRLTSCAALGFLRPYVALYVLRTSAEWMCMQCRCAYRQIHAIGRKFSPTCLFVLPPFIILTAMCVVLGCSAASMGP